MINLRRPIVALTLALTAFGLCGCSLFSSASEEASAAFESANTSIDEHNRLFAEARETYDSVKTNIEDGERPANQREDIVQARSNLQEARGHLQEAQDQLEPISDMNVQEPVREYARTFTDAVNQQLTAEATEIEFYDLLEENPSLDGSRDEALALLDEVGNGYASAEEAYAEAQRLANENSDIISPTDSGNTE